MSVKNAKCGDIEVLFEKIQDVQAVLAEMSFVEMYVVKSKKKKLSYPRNRPWRPIRL
jgi:hypothetical protein